MAIPKDEAPSLPFSSRGKGQSAGARAWSSSASKIARARERPQSAKQLPKTPGRREEFHLNSDLQAGSKSRRCRAFPFHAKWRKRRAKSELKALDASQGFAGGRRVPLSPRFYLSREPLALKTKIDLARPSQIAAKGESSMIRVKHQA